MSESVDWEILPRTNEPWVEEIGVSTRRWEYVEDTNLLTIERVAEATIFDESYKGKLEPTETREYRQRLVVEQDSKESEQSSSKQSLRYTVKLVDGIRLNSPPRSGEVVQRHEFGQLEQVSMFLRAFVDEEYLTEIYGRVDNLGERL